MNLWQQIFSRKKIERESISSNPIVKGGHALAFSASSDGSQLIKKTSQNEADLYKDMNKYEALKAITPQVSSIDSTTNSVTMENLTHGFHSEGLAIIDVKLGRSTYSRDVSKAKMGKKSRFKQFKMAVVDKIVSRSFKVIQGKGAVGRLKAAKNSQNIIDSALIKNPEVVNDLLEQLKIIKENLKSLPLAFFGHSVLIVMGKDSEGKPKLLVKLIDIGNHMTEDEARKNGIMGTYQELRENTQEAIDDMIKDIQESQSKINE